MLERASGLLNDGELIQFLNLDLKERTIQDSRTSGILGNDEAPPHVKIGTKSLYRITDLLIWIDNLSAKVTNAEHRCS
tara:strand:- start:2169 stop:2402 length:234 start_codon:yes stop_codon:yes gene_type:complete